MKDYKDDNLWLMLGDCLERMKDKLIRKKETDSIKKFVEYAQDQGSDSAANYYTAITRMTNKLIKIEAGQRDLLSADTLQKVAIIEGIVDIAIRDGMNADMPYKEVYKLAKTRASSTLTALGIE